MSRWTALVGLLVIGCGAQAQTSAPFDAAAAFGARDSVIDLSLSPDGNMVAFVTATPGAGTAVFTLALAAAAKATPVLVAGGKPDRLLNCNWVANDRLACMVYGIVPKSAELLPFSRLVGVNSDGSNQKQLSTESSQNSRGYQLGGGGIVDLLPEQDGMILMARNYLPNDRPGSVLGTTVVGLGVDLLNTRTLAVRHVEQPNAKADWYISDGHGNIRVMGLTDTVASGQMSGATNFMYRAQGSQEWRKLGTYDEMNRTGFEPLAVDRDQDLVYGVKKKDGRLALYSIALDGSMKEALVFSRPDVDIDDVVRIGRRNRVVGVSFATEYRSIVYFDAEISKEVAAISKALPAGSTVSVLDSSADENKLLVLAARDDNPGKYYLYDRQKRSLEALFESRGALRGVKLAKVKPVSYKARDGVEVPAYLTLPPGVDNAKGLPAIVMPHGGPSARDYWGFDWLSQFFAARGYAVVQPNYRGSEGFGDAWYENNGFQSWPTAMNDVLDAGRWLISEGIADPAKLGIVGWSYGGYAALQSAIVDPTVFKAVVAIAPVTDLQQLKDDSVGWTNHEIVSRFVGSGPHVRAGSPARNAEKIRVPVLMFQGTIDRNVSIAHTRLMAKSLAAAKAPYELVTWEGLDHQLDDSTARTEMLRKSDEFLRKAFGN